MRTCLFLLISLLLSACSSAPTAIQYYMLDDPAQPMPAVNHAAPTVTLQSLSLPDYLRQDGLVMRLGNNQLQLSSLHYWAQRIDSSIETIMLKQLNGSGVPFQLLSVTEPQAQQSHYKLHIQVIHLLIEQQSNVRLQARYWVTDNRNDKTLLSGNSDITTELTADGYEHAVTKMHLALVRFSQQIGEELGATLAAN